MLRIDVLLVLVSGAFVLAPQAIGRPGPRPSQSEEREADPLHCPSRSSDEVPEGLAASDWSSIRDAYEANRHAAFAVEGGYQARNPGQGWWTRFDSRGFLVQPDAGGWEWGLQLERYGFAGDEHPVSEPLAVSAAGQRVAYDWDGILEEWYVNDTRGLEHGYTVHQRPPQSPMSKPGPLTFLLPVRGDLQPEVTADGRSVHFTNELGVSVLTYAGLTVLDADGKDLAGAFERVAGGLLLSIDERHARYPLTIDPIAQQAYLKASNTGGFLNGNGDWFGQSVSVSGNTVVVGAPNEDSNATGVNGDGSNDDAEDSGAAYVFVRNNGTWSQEAYLKASNTGGGTAFLAGDQFGWSVSVSGDTVVVGAHLEDSASGAAYVFERNGASWYQAAYLKASNTEALDHFGLSVSVSGDTVVVGADLEDSNATGVNGDQSNNDLQNSGAVYVFVRNNGTWSQEAYLKASNTGGPPKNGFLGDSFGFSVAASGNRVLVGAWGEDSIAKGVNGNQSDDSITDSGAAYVFVRSGTSWSQEAYLKPTGTFSVPNARYGWAVAMSGDTVVIGAPYYLEGAAFMLVRTGTGWKTRPTLQSSNLDPGDSFGWSVAVSGGTVLVGAIGEDSSASGVNGDQDDNSLDKSGAAYVFVPSGSQWIQETYLKASNPGSRDNFGWSVAISGNTALVGAPYENSNSTGVNGNQANEDALDSGAAYVFETCSLPAVASRNAGTNPASYMANPIAIGAAFTATVDNNLASQLTSILFAFDTPFTFTLGGGQTLLCLDLGGSGEAFTGAGLFPSSSAGGVDSFSLPFANDPATCGVVFYSQAIQFGNPPFVLSNAQDLTIGSF